MTDENAQLPVPALRCEPASPLAAAPAPHVHPVGSALSEFGMIERYFAPMASAGGLGLEDDAALLRPPPGHDLVVTVDALVAGIHFFPDDPPGRIAQKALRSNLSDLAAKGATPLGFLLTFGLSAGQDEAWIAAFANGLAEDARLFQCPLYGGDTVRSTKALPAENRSGEGLFLSITVFGHVPQGQMVPRQGGRPGDHLYITGTIGDAALGLALRLAPDAPWAPPLAEEERAHLLSRYLLPLPRLALTQALRLHASAAMDLSDGLVGDCEKLAKHLGRQVDVARIPLSQAARMAIKAEPTLLETVLTGGDDYEILTAIPPANTMAFEQAAQAAGVPVTCIGQLAEPGAPNRWIGEGGSPMAFTRRSYTHF
jgi:thiamine-monophosphate kinase